MIAVMLNLTRKIDNNLPYNFTTFKAKDWIGKINLKSYT